MGEIERRGQGTITPGGNPVCEKCKEIGGPGHRCKPRRDPTEWRPRPNTGWEWADSNVSAQSMRSEPMNYGSLVDVTDSIPGIEANARAALIAAMDRSGLTPDERGIRVQWQCVVVGHGFRQPEGFIHPEAPDEIKREGREAWKRVVEIASDSVTKFLFVKVWRRKPSHRGLPAPDPRTLEGVPFQAIGSDDPDEIVDAEIVEDEG